jgi:hypothetical protein
LGDFSPTGTYFAYASGEQGPTRVYVRPFPAKDGFRVPVSEATGTAPRWSPDGREIFYLDGGYLMSVSVTTTGGVHPGMSTRLFSTAAYSGAGAVWPPVFTVTKDGKRFLFLKLLVPPGSPKAAATIVVRTNATMK